MFSSSLGCWMSLVGPARQISRNFSVLRSCAKERQQLPEMMTSLGKEKGFLAEETSFGMSEIEIVCFLVVKRRLFLLRGGQAHSC